MVEIPTALKPEHVSLILTTLSEPGYEVAHDMFLLALHTGMEAGDLTKLQWSQVQLNSRTLRYESRDKQRIVPMSFTVHAILALLWKERSSETFVFGMIPENVKVAVQKVWHKVAEQLGVPRFGFRSLRYTCLERMVNSGYEIAAAYAFVGLASRNFWKSVKAESAPITSADLDRIWQMPVTRPGRAESFPVTAESPDSSIQRTPEQGRRSV